MRGERFDTEGLGRVMTAEKEINSELFRRYRSPVWRFAGDERVDKVPVRLGLLRDAINFAARAAGNDSDMLRIFRPEIESLH